jgi:RNA recognition motif-containing protein
MGNKLYVGNLAFSATENDLMDLFAQYGAVTDANLIMDRATQRPRGFAFVTMANDEDAAKAAQELNGSQFQGRPLTVNEARPPEPRFGGGGGGGGGRPGGGGGGRKFDRGGGGGGGGGRKFDRGGGRY